MTAFAQRDYGIDSSLVMDWEKYDPPATLVVPENPVNRAKFPFIDVHSHQWRMDTSNLDKLVSDMNDLNMGVMVNLSGRNSEKLKNMVENTKRQNYDNRIVVFSNIEWRSIDES